MSCARIDAHYKQNFPYATIDPEEARVIVPDDRFDWLVEHYKPKSVVPANLTIYDIAGLTRGASTGAGLGNAFLSHIRAVDALFQVVRCFDDAEIIHVEGDVDPIRDLEIIADELRIKDIEFVEKSYENIQKQTRRGGQSLEMKKLKEEQATIEKILQHLKDGKPVYHADWTPKEVSHTIFSKTLASRFHDEQELYARLYTQLFDVPLTQECYEKMSLLICATLAFFQSTKFTTTALSRTVMLTVVFRSKSSTLFSFSPPSPVSTWST